MRSIDDQIDAMRSSWPNFELLHQHDRAAIWQGRVKPDGRSFLLQIAYRVPLAIENWTPRDVQPRVQVREPKLEFHPDYEEGPLPHVYHYESEQTLPFLCLFDPHTGDWTPEDLLAETTVYWAIDWLYFYEGWLVTKKWKGGGRHYGRKNLNASNASVTI